MIRLTADHLCTRIHPSTPSRMSQQSSDAIGGSGPKQSCKHACVGMHWDRTYDPVDLGLLLHVHALVVVETVDSAGYPRLGFFARQALDGINVRLSLWHR